MQGFCRWLVGSRTFITIIYNLRHRLPCFRRAWFQSRDLECTNSSATVATAITRGRTYYREGFIRRQTPAFSAYSSKTKPKNFWVLYPGGYAKTWIISQTTARCNRVRTNFCFFLSYSGTRVPALARLGEPLGEGDGGEDPTEDEPHHRPQPVHLDLDTGAQLVAAGSDLHVEAGDEDIKRVRNKIDWHILPLMCSGCFSMSHSIAVALCPHPQLQFWLTTPAALYWIQFMDKTTLGSAAILDIRYSCPVVVRQLCQGLNHTHIGRQPISQRISKY